MLIIEKIEIKHFRSFDGGGKTKVEILDLKDINVFSGKNDSGKSNVLRALNLFFNNELSPGVPFNLDRDLSKIQRNRSDSKANQKRTEGKKDVRQKDLWVKIKVYFKKETEGVLPASFFVEKLWDKNGLNPNRSHNIKKVSDPNKARAQEGQLSLFLNNIQFEYVPAVKDRQFFNFLFKKLQDYLFEKQDKKKGNTFKSQSLKFNDLLEEETKVLFKEFKTSTGVTAKFNIPNTLVDFFRTLGVETENGISLFDRGDGIQARFIPDILNEISKDSRKKIIWGFEEPENSYEPFRCFELAQNFVEYSKEKQIFITTHSFPFIALKGVNISSYRVESENGVSHIGKIDWKQRTIKGEGFENDADKIEKEIGIVETYEKLSEHLGKSLKKQKDQIFVEDEKKEIYKIIWLKLNNFDCNISNFDQLFREKAPFSFFDKGGRISLQKYLDAPAVQEQEGKKIIGIFDFDDAFDEVKRLNNMRWGNLEGEKATCLTRKRNDHPCFFAILLPVPVFRNNYADPSYIHNYLTLEHLFEDAVLQKINCFDGYSTPSGAMTMIQIKGKRNLWKKLFDLPEEDFIGFKPLFDKINDLLDIK